MINNLFCCEDICKSYNDQPVVRDISLCLREGETLGLLGASGVGKSTLMSILAGVSRPDSGRVLLEGQEITGIPGRVGYMLQKDLLLPFKSTLDNICLPLLFKGAKKNEARQKARQQMELFGLSGSEEKYPYQLSGGMRQRAALARTHFLGNKVILLDEPFAALDAITKSEMHRWYLDVAAKTGLSTIFITHDVDEALTLSDRLYIMTGIPGRLTAEIAMPSGRPEDFALTGQFLELKREVLGHLAVGG